MVVTKHVIKSANVTTLKTNAAKKIELGEDDATKLSRRRVEYVGHIGQTGTLIMGKTI